MTTIQSIDHRHLPRKKRTPSGRDQAILVAYRTQGLTQAELAKQHRLSQRRISEIIHRVEKWRASTWNLEPETLNPAAQRRLERWLMRERSQAILDRALRAFDHQLANPTHTTTRTESKPTSGAGVSPASFSPERAPLRSSGRATDSPSADSRFPTPDSLLQVTKVTTTTRPISLNVQLLKIAQRSAADLHHLAELDPLPAPPTPKEDDKQTYRTVFKQLFQWREKAEIEGRVPHSTDVYWLVKNLLDALLGQQPACGRSFRQPDDAVKDLLRNFLNCPPDASPNDPAPDHLVAELACAVENATSFNPEPTATDISASTVGPASAAPPSTEPPPPHPHTLTPSHSPSPPSNSSNPATDSPPQTQPPPQLASKIQNPKYPIPNPSTLNPEPRTLNPRRKPIPLIFRDFIEEQNLVNARNRIIFQRFEEEDMRCFKNALVATTDPASVEP